MAVTKTRVEQDAQLEVFRIFRVDATGAPLVGIAAPPASNGNSQVLVQLGDLSPDGTARVAQFRLLQWKDASTCNKYQAYFLMTAPEGPL